jgi:hypothetical protein
LVFEALEVASLAANGEALHVLKVVDRVRGDEIVEVLDATLLNALHAVIFLLACLLDLG